ncbi:hypothetical protein ABE437_19485 [Isoptericola cucumis]|uniref:hypothetical protein n=1 Tax=Isoptericola cucumis TaxID=1776856 RepID=UPI0032096DB9
MTVTRLRSTIALLVAVAFALLGAVVAPIAAQATGGGHDAKPGQEVCTDGDGWIKVDVGGEKTEHVVTADEGYLIDAVCVKSSTTMEVTDVEPPRPSVTVSSPSSNKKGQQQAISHVAYHQVPATFDWDWPYPAPVCDAGLTVIYPENLPADQANDVNVRVKNLETDEEWTGNFHRADGTWSGEQSFDPTTLAGWPGWAHYAYVWAQVGGTNYHWSGEVECGEPGTPEPPSETTPPTEPEDEPTEPTLEGSTAVGECVADAPWIGYDVRLTPADAELDDRTIELVLTDGTHTETLALGELGDDGTLSGRVLWPGAAVAADGETPTAWPGWEQLDNGTWVETDGNFAWTRGDISATFVVNPDLTVDLDYPPATPDCAAMPAQAGGAGGADDVVAAPVEGPDAGLDAPVTTVEAGADELPRTGASVAWIVAGALLLVGAGVTVLMVLRRRA